MSEMNPSPRLRRLFALVALVLAVALLGACGDDGDEDGEGVGAVTTAEDGGGEDDGGGGEDNGGAADTTEAPAGGTTVTVENFEFNPETVTVSAGDSVTWTFQDAAPHNVSGEGFESDNLSDGEEFSHTFDEAGTFEYVCTLHPGMAGTVEVQ
jgi:plastocyanin